MTYYNRVMLGPGSAFAAECFDGGFIGADFGITEDLTDHLPEDWTAFNKAFIPVWLEKHPGKTRVTAGLSCGLLWTISKGIRRGDMVLSPDGKGSYRLGEVIGDYLYAPDGHLPHRRPVRWTGTYIDKTAMSEQFRASVGTGLATCNITQYEEEINRLIVGTPQLGIIATHPEIEDPATFALEKHLEDFLVANWPKTELGKDYAIFNEDGQTGQQYPTDTGPIDILAVRKDKKELLVVELKRGRASDVVVGQVLRYMGYVLDVLAVEGQSVRGVIIALDDDQKLKRALAVTPNVSFYRYTIIFKLEKG